MVMRHEIYGYFRKFDFWLYTNLAQANIKVSLTLVYTQPARYPICPEDTHFQPMPGATKLLTQGFTRQHYALGLIFFLNSISTKSPRLKSLQICMQHRCSNLLNQTFLWASLLIIGSASHPSSEKNQENSIKQSKGFGVTLLSMTIINLKLSKREEWIKFLHGEWQ